jgi:prephenate dehydratase
MISKTKGDTPQTRGAAVSAKAPAERVVYQGEPGANSHLACREAFPDLEAVACPTFEDALLAVRSGEARYAMIPIENSVAGRVADIHHLLPDADLYIIGEHFLRVRHQLMAAPGATLETVKRVLSHTQALGQCRRKLHELGLRPAIRSSQPSPRRLPPRSMGSRFW